jgi:hypothetical protein
VSTAIEPDVARTLSRRAREIARDRGLSVAEGAEHLARLARGRASVVRAALDALHAEPAPDEPDQAHAELLLQEALAVAELHGPA